jgi:hypothetical protein
MTGAKFAMPGPRNLVLRLVQELYRVPPVAITLHVRERGFRHIRAGSCPQNTPAAQRGERGNAEISSELAHRMLPLGPQLRVACAAKQFAVEGYRAQD